MNKGKIIKLFSNISNREILCIGDLILDIFVEGSVNRISPEAPVPVLLKNTINYQLGGAGNVSRNITSLGSKASIFSLIGNDESSYKISQILKKEKKIKPYFFKANKYKLPTKIRYVSKSNQLLRVDDENNFALNNKLEDKIFNLFIKRCKSFKTVVLSNYKKGILSLKLINKIISYCNENKLNVLVDPKYKDFSIYKGATLITPNQREFSNAVNKEFKNIAQIVREGQKLIKKLKFTYILVTRSEEGMILISENKFKNFPVTAQEVYDVTGAGDTVIGSLAVGLDAGMNMNDSVQFANYAAGIVVEKRGTAVASKSEIISKIK